MSWSVAGPGHADGFPLFSGLLAVIAGPVMLAAGWPAGWAFLLLATGIVLVFAHWAIANRIQFRPLHRTDLIVAVIGLASLWLAVVYFTHTANDLPRLLPGYDVDSARLEIVPGVVAFTVGAAALGRALTAAHPTRPND